MTCIKVLWNDETRNFDKEQKKVMDAPPNFFEKVSGSVVACSVSVRSSFHFLPILCFFLFLCLYVRELCDCDVCVFCAVCY